MLLDEPFSALESPRRFIAASTLFGLPVLVLAADGTAGSTVNNFIDAWFAISDAAKHTWLLTARAAF